MGLSGTVWHGYQMLCRESYRETGAGDSCYSDQQYSQSQLRSFIYYHKDMPISQKETNLGMLACIPYRYTLYYVIIDKLLY